MTDPERFLLAQDIFWRLVTQPNAKYDQGSLDAACDVAFVAASVYFTRLDEEKARLAKLEHDLMRDQLAHELATNSKNVPGPKNDDRAKGKRRGG